MEIGTQTETTERTPMIDFEHVDDETLNHFIAQMAQFHSESTPINKAFFMEHLMMGLKEHARRAEAANAKWLELGGPPEFLS